LQGSTKGLRTGIAAGDALLGGTASIAGSLERDPAGVLVVDQLAIAGAAASLSGDAKFDPISNQLRGALALEVPRLKPLGPTLGTDMAGALIVHIDADGTLDHLRIDSKVEGNDVAAGGSRIDRLRLSAQVPDLAKSRAALDGTYRAYGF